MQFLLSVWKLSDLDSTSPILLVYSRPLVYCKGCFYQSLYKLHHWFGTPLWYCPLLIWKSRQKHLVFQYLWTFGYSDTNISFDISFKPSSLAIFTDSHRLFAFPGLICLLKNVIKDFQGICWSCQDLLFKSRIQSLR